MTTAEQLEKMRRDWDERARENARYYVATGNENWTDEEFFESGERTVAEDILTDMTNVCQGKDPKEMRVLEIGCGAARVTRALAGVFGEVHAVDVSGEMVTMAGKALQDLPNAHVYQNNGIDLRVLPGDKPYDFAYSSIVFQHIPSRDVIYSYAKEVHRLLRPGGLFKFQVQGDSTISTAPDDTWLGVGFSRDQASEMARDCGFELRYDSGAGEQYFWLWFFRHPDNKIVTTNEQLEKMKRDWDERARENARYYVATGNENWTDEEFFASGERSVAEDILTDMTNVCQGKDPKQMRVLEIGCGAARVTRALAGLFGEVYAVDVSGEMVGLAGKALQDRPNAHVYQNNGMDLRVLPDDKPYDFAYSGIVFQHIPSRDVIYSYVKEVHRLLRPGGLFKFQVQGDSAISTTPDDTWLGVAFSRDQATDMARDCGFELRYHYGAGEQYFWLWFFRNR